MFDSFGSRVVFAKENCRVCCCSNPFNLHATVTVQTSNLCSFCGSLFDWKLKPSLTRKTNDFSQTNWTRDFDPDEYFHKTICHLVKRFVSSVDFPRHSVTISRERAPLDKISADKLCNPFKFSFEDIQSLLEMKESDWQLVHYIFFWFVFPIMAFPYMVIRYWVTIATIFHHYFFCIPTVKLLQTLRSFQSILLNSHYWQDLLESRRKYCFRKLLYPHYKT